jgi:hypothetical protein
MKVYTPTTEKETHFVCLDPPKNNPINFKRLNAMRTRGIILLVLIVLVSITFLPNTLPPELQSGWIPPRMFEVTAVVQTADGGFALAGGLKTHHDARCCLCITAAYEGREMLLLKTDANGVILWHRSYHHNFNPHNGGSVLIQTTDGGFALGGWTSKNVNMWLVKTDANGVVLWTQIYRDPISFNVVAAITPTLGWAISLLLAAVVLIRRYKRPKKLE